MRRELEPEGIGVSALCPGAVFSNLRVNSGRLRPDRYGGSYETAPPVRRPEDGYITGEAVGEFVIRGVKANRPYIFTHPDIRAAIESQQRAVLDDLDFITAG